MKRFVFILSALLYTLFFSTKTFAADSAKKQWEFQSIDTMKYSRDLAREKLLDSSFDKEIERQMKEIAKTGATHVAIGTPYDPEFRPILIRWVKMARKNNLNIWFRGNWSGWEGWFGYPKLSAAEHIKKTEAFILENKALFENNDVFTACPECENGGDGDPRLTRKIKEFRNFRIKEYQTLTSAFSKIGKEVDANYNSMNADVARLIMDKQTTKSLGGIVVIDHYVGSAEQLNRDINEISESSGGNIILGEFGAPIPDIHGIMTPQEQASWIQKALGEVASNEHLLGINYWVGVGGTTAIWSAEGNAYPAVSVLREFFTGSATKIAVVDEAGYPITTASLFINGETYTNEKNGYFLLPYFQDDQTVLISAPKFVNKEFVMKNDPDIKVILLHEKETLLLRIQRFFSQFFNH